MIKQYKKKYFLKGFEYIGISGGLSQRYRSHGNSKLFNEKDIVMIVLSKNKNRRLAALIEEAILIEVFGLKNLKREDAKKERLNKGRSVENMQELGGGSGEEMARTNCCHKKHIT